MLSENTPLTPEEREANQRIHAQVVDEVLSERIVVSPTWDAKLSLSEMLDQAKFFVIVKDGPEIAKVVHSERILESGKRYDYYGIGHDQFGVTYYSDGSVDADFLGDRIKQGKADLTTEKEILLDWIGKVMNWNYYG